MLSRRWALAGCMIVAMMVLVAGCSLDYGNPLISTDDGSEGLVAPDRVADHSQFVTYRQAPERALAKVLANDYTEELIEWDVGGVLKVGDTSTIKGKLEIWPESISEVSALVSMALPQGELLIVGVGGEDGIIFGPSGLTFAPPAELKIRSGNLDLPEGDLYLCYWNEETEEWEPTDQQVEVGVDSSGRVTLEVKIPHFSRYAFRSL